MNAEQVLEHFKQTNALLEDIFVIERIAQPKYLQCALALQYPLDAAKFGQRLLNIYEP
jgi:hypothetical protein